MVNQETFRHALGHFATGVTVVTTHDADGTPRGFTATSFTSLSLTPPLVLVCVSKSSQTHNALDTVGATFAVNILSRQQEEFSRLFASQHGDKFDGLSYHIGHVGAPILPDVLAFVECRVAERWSSGDHTVIIGAVEHLEVAPDAEPLLYYRGRYAAVTQLLNPVASCAV